MEGAFVGGLLVHWLRNGEKMESYFIPTSRKTWSAVHGNKDRARRKLKQVLMGEKHMYLQTWFTCDTPRNTLLSHVP